MNRRDFLWNYGGGLGGIALAGLLGQKRGLLADAPAGLHHPAKAKLRHTGCFMFGAASQCDTFDYKPKLIEKNGQQFDPGGKVELFQSSAGAVMKSPCGMEATRQQREMGQQPRFHTWPPLRRRYGLRPFDGISKSNVPRAGLRSCKTLDLYFLGSLPWGHGFRMAWAA